jgi:glycosyltransferase involved in cell wall biosynthesis
MKRQRLVVEAARHLRSGMKIVIAGQGSQNETSYLQDLISDHGLGDRVVMAGYVSEAEKLAYYARCRGVFFGGYDEDYGYVVLEAFYARKPVLTLQDTGGALEFVKNGHNGFIVPADAPAVAERIDALGSDQVMAERLGTAGAETIKEMKIDWDHVISSLIGTANA